MRPRRQEGQSCYSAALMTPILFSVSYSGSWGQARLDLFEFVDKAADLGFKGVMLGGKRPHLCPLDWSADQRTALRRRIEAAGLTEVVVAAYNNFTADLEHAESPMREIQIAHVADLAQTAADLGGSKVRVFTGYQHPRSPHYDQWQMIVRCLRECSHLAAKHGVSLAVQNHHDIAVDHRSLKDLLKAVGEPNCLAAFDAWAPALHGTDLGTAARAMAPMTTHTTVADYQLRPRFRYEPEAVSYAARQPYAQAVPMGEGFVDYREFFSGLRAGGFSGTVAYEMCSPLLGGGSVENLDRHARSFLSFIDSLA